MSSTTIFYLQLIVLISNLSFISRTIAGSQCDLASAFHIQWATYSHSLILRVQPDNTSVDESGNSNVIFRRVFVRELIKIPRTNHRQPAMQMNDVILLRIDADTFIDNSCWHSLRLFTSDVILFLNDSNNLQFDLHYPPVEATGRVRENIETVLHHETYPPQVLIKTRLDRAISSQDYSLQCNSRGNPLPRLFWSKTTGTNETLVYYRSSKQCQTPCRIYSIQNKYQSILYLHSLTLDDIGIYVCHAENPMNHTTTSVYLNIDRRSHSNLTCASLKFCSDRGQCVMTDKQLKCLCNDRYFGEQCETSYDDIIKRQETAILLFKSRFLAGFILVLVVLVLVLIALLSWFLARNNRRQEKKFRKKLPIQTPVKEIPPVKDSNGIIPSPVSPLIEKTIRPPTPPTSVHISHSPILDKQSLTPPVVRGRNIPSTLTRESSTATDDDDDDGLNSFLRQYQTLPPVPTKIDEEYEERFSLKMNKSEELGLGCLTNGSNTSDLILSHGYADFYQPDNQTGLIRPLHVRTEPSAPQRYTKYVSSYSKFVLPRPVKSKLSSSLEYQQR